MESARTVHLVGHRTLTPGVPGAMSSLISSNSYHLLDEHLTRLVISSVVSKAA